MATTTSSLCASWSTLSSTGAPCHPRPAAIEIVFCASRNTFSAWPSLLTRPHLRLARFPPCGLRSTFSAFAGYDDIGPERFEDYIFVVFHYIVPVLFEESLDPYDNYTPPSSTRAPGHLRPWRVEEYILGSLPCLFEGVHGRYLLLRALPPHLHSCHLLVHLVPVRFEEYIGITFALISP